MRVLVDTSVLVALHNEDDSLHTKARELSPLITQPIITEIVFDEFMNVLTRRRNRAAALQAGNALLQSNIEVELLSGVDFMLAWNLFQQHAKLSYADCTNIAVMQSLGITQIATFDQAFKEVKGIDVME